MLLKFKGFNIYCKSIPDFGINQLKHFNLKLYVLKNGASEWPRTERGTAWD